MNSLLEKIIADRRQRQPLAIDSQKLDRMLEQCRAEGPVRSLAAALRKQPAVIAEIKRRSPSNGEFDGFRDPALLGLAYERNGAAAISVLTNESFFGMRKQDLTAVSSAVGIPVLRKEFIISRFDILESRLLGADAVLLIVTLLDDEELRELNGLAQECGLEVLLEVHTEGELERALRLGPDIIGVNARNLDSLAMDLDACLRLAEMVPQGIIAVAESGIAGQPDIARYLKHSIGAFLVGTELLRHEKPERRLGELLGREVASD